MDNKTPTGPVPPYEAHAPQHMVSPMPTGAYDSNPAVAPQQHDPYNQGPPPSHPPPGASSPTQYPHQPIAPLSQQPQPQQHYAQVSPAASPPPQIQHQHSMPMATPGVVSSPGQEKHEYYNPAGQQQPQGIPMQPQGQVGQQAPAAQGHQYQTAVPLNALNRAAAPVDCPVCRTRALTRIELHSGNTTHVWALVLCACLCIGCIPYLVSGTKDVEHKCGHCGVMLAVYHRSGTTEVLQHA